MVVWCVPLEAGLGSWAAPRVPAVELALVVLVCPWQERKKPSVPHISPLSLVFPSQRESAHSPAVPREVEKCLLHTAQQSLFVGVKAGDWTPK